ncbi:MAG: DUF2027 domain-containing protein [Bacteroidota bacterium]|jgi:hypothetical protein
MKIRIGDKVRFLNEAGGGVVSRYKDKDHVFVEIEDGFEVPYPARLLVVTETELIVNKDAENLDLEPNLNPDENILFVIEPDHELPILTDYYSIYLFNQSEFHIYFTYSVKDGHLFQTLKNGELGPFQKLLMKKIKKSQLSEYNYNKIEILFFKKSHYVAQIPVAEVVLLNEKIISKGTFIRNEEFKNPVMYFVLRDKFLKETSRKIKLTDYDVERLQKFDEFHQPSAPVSKPHRRDQLQEEKEIDLHIEELLENISGMSNGEMLNYQIKIFQKELDLAITSNLKKIIFIHGVGNGRLKSEIRHILKSYPELIVSDASYKKYGYGGTEVILR